LDLLLVLRVLTLTGWLVLAVGSLYIVLAQGTLLPQPVRNTWLIVAVRHSVVATTTLVVEAVAFLSVYGPGPQAAALGMLIYNPAYLLNAVVSAVVPFIAVRFLTRPRTFRRTGLAGSIGAVAIALLAVRAGAASDWTVLMSWTQALSFLEIAGYLLLWALVLLGHLKRIDPYLLGIFAITALYTLLLPVQAEFFEVVGRIDSTRIWHLNQFLQLVVVVTSLLAVLARIGHLTIDPLKRDIFKAFQNMRSP